MKSVHKINESLEGLAVDLSTLVPLPGNPRKGDVEAIMASYTEFGQLKPIVIRPNSDGTSTVIAGNHQTEAARRLGWSHIAAVSLDTDDKRALAFALADNRSMELGTTDPVLLHEAVISVIDDYSEVFDALGWDDFQLASMEEQVEYINASDIEPSGYMPPVMISQPGEIIEAIQTAVQATTQKTDENVHVQAPTGTNELDAITRGSTSVGTAGTKAIVQYMLVFDNADQQRRWYDFLRWLRSDPGNDGDTAAEKLLIFLEAHADF